MATLSVERPTSRDKQLRAISNVDDECSMSGGVADGVVASLGNVQYASRSGAILTEGCLSEEQNRRATLRIKIRPSVFVVETNKEYTLQEMSTTQLDKIITKRIDAIAAASNAASAAATKRRRCDASTLREGQRFLTQESVRGLKSVSGILPVVIKVSNWTIHNDDEIRFDARGDEGVEHLVNATHVDTEEWERNRVSALTLSNAVGVFYAHHGLLDVVVTKSPFSNNDLQNPVVFRIENMKLWLGTPLQLAVPSKEKKTRDGVDEANEKRVLYQHPSLIRVSDLRSLASRSEAVSALLVPGITIFNPSELESIGKDRKAAHYFTAQGFMSKASVSNEQFIDQQHKRMMSNNLADTTTLNIAGSAHIPAKGGGGGGGGGGGEEEDEKEGIEVEKKAL